MNAACAFPLLSSVPFLGGGGFVAQSAVQITDWVALVSHIWRGYGSQYQGPRIHLHPLVSICGLSLWLVVFHLRNVLLSSC
ncbi:hypothetical protein DL93DRAFT_2200756 [Clavulina sp. PMI_390]|nr:hypothetical protein DL93DRAFT_2200756 [Clavulina sp. PMI_390]